MCNRIRQRTRYISACHQLVGDWIVLFEILPVFASPVYGNRRHGLLVHFLHCVWFKDSFSNSDYTASSGRALENNDLEMMRITFFSNITLCPRRAYRPLMTKTILSSDQMVTAARNATDAHAPDFVANGNLILLTLKVLAQCTRSLHATQKASCFHSV